MKLPSTRSNLWAAAIVLGVAACGGDDAPADPDAAPSPDADQTPDATALGEVTMTLEEDGAPRVGVPVLFYQPDGSLAAEVDTDATGQAAADLLPGGSVVLVDLGLTAAVAGGSGAPAVAYVGVQPGDQLRFAPSSGGPGSVTTTLTSATFAGADQYRFELGCGPTQSSATPSATFTNISCPASTSVAVLAFQAGTLVASVYAPTVTLAAAVAVPGAFVAPETVTVTATGLSPALTGAEIEAYRSTTDRLQVGPAIEASTTGGAMVVATGPQPAIPGATQRLLHRQERDGFPNRYALANVPTAAAISFDVSEHLPPWLGPVVFDAKGGTLQFTTVGDGGIDYAIAAVSATHAGGGGYFWYVHGKLDGRPYKFPILPAAYAAAQPQPSDELNSAFALLINADAPRVDLMRTEFGLLIDGEAVLFPEPGGHVALSGNF
ncbi:MAG: hypothetical protein R2939_17695 [Kofleriaceae bacterium]